MEEATDIRQGDCREVMSTMPDCSVDAIVTDPPYGLSFMGKGWDHGVPGVEFWTEALRVAKPGAHLLAFGGTRTYHRLACAIEDAGWEIRNCVYWAYGSGFPKSLDVSKAIDKAAGAERAVVKGGGRSNVGTGARSDGKSIYSQVLVDPTNAKTVKNDISLPATDAAKQWAGWGTALKPAVEPMILARKPLIGNVAENVMRHGTGGINVEGCRVGTDDNLNGGAYAKNGSERTDEWGASNGFRRNQGLEFRQPSGRWPANVIHDGSDEVVGLFGSAARFFYCAKASKADRDAGCERNHHPTVKPTNLMRYLCRLVTPPGGVVLDPFMGSGSTGKAAILEGFRFIGIDLNPEYIEIARGRIAQAAQESTTLF